MADVLFRTTFLLLYAAASLLVLASWAALRVAWAVVRWTWRTVPPVVGRFREARRLTSSSRPLVRGALVR